MYRGFNLSLSGSFKDEYYEYGKDLFESQKRIVKSNMENYIIKRGILDGNKIQSDWFPTVDADVFISHSHGDEYLATCLAGWLSKEIKIKSFIDSHVWGYAKELIELLDNNHSKIGVNLYNYSSVLLTTSHVHTMLNIAITSMIDKTECLFFLNTPKSLSTKTISENAVESITGSPWIFSELSISQRIRKKTKEQHRRKVLVEKASLEGIDVEYVAPIHHLSPISVFDLILLELNKDEHEYPLDIVYDNNPVHSAID
ncbi:hypothetical protein [Azospirillum palustre]